jgi:hypothetical protein
MNKPTIKRDKQLDLVNAETNNSGWQSAVAWLSAVGQAMDYDTQTYTNASISQMKETISRLEQRLQEVEQNKDDSPSPID